MNIKDLENMSIEELKKLHSIELNKYYNNKSLTNDTTDINSMLSIWNSCEKYWENANIINNVIQNKLSC